MELTSLTDAVAQSANGVFVLFRSLMTLTTPILTSACWKSIEQIGSYSKQIRSGNPKMELLEPHEKSKSNDSYLVNFEVAGAFNTGLFRFFAFPERITPASVQLRASWRRLLLVVEKLTHEQFNNTLPSLATDCASCTGWKSEGGVLLCSECTGDRKL